MGANRCSFETFHECGRGHRLQGRGPSPFLPVPSPGKVERSEWKWEWKWRGGECSVILNWHGLVFVLMNLRSQKRRRQG